MIKAAVTGIAAIVAFLPAFARQTGLPPSTPPEWTQRQAPFRIFGNTYYAGTRGLSVVLITSEKGHLLIDGALPESAAMIADHIRALGFRVEDVELIVNSHVHYDHAGGIGALQRLSGAQIAASPSSAAVFRSGRSGPDDPQYGLAVPIDRVSNVRVIADRGKLPFAVELGERSVHQVQAHLAAGHMLVARREGLVDAPERDAHLRLHRVPLMLQHLGLVAPGAFTAAH